MHRILIFASLVAAHVTPASAQGHTVSVIEKSTQLPEKTFVVPGRPSDFLLVQQKEVEPFLASVERDLRELLARYDIRDLATRAQFLRALAQLDVMNSRLDEADREFSIARVLESKPDARAFTGLQQQALVAAERSGLARDSEAYATAYRDAFSRSIDTLDPVLVIGRVNALRQQTLQSLSNVYVGLAREAIDPLAANGRIPRDAALRLIDYRFRIRYLIPLKRSTLAVLRQFNDGHPVIQPDIWAERSLDLNGQPHLSPVRVAIWDTGFDPALFRAKLFTGSDGRPATIAFDVQQRPSPGHLRHLTPTQRSQAPEAFRMQSGLTDQAAGRDTSDALAVQDRLSQLKPEEMAAFLESIGAIGNYGHGTMVTGLAADANPAIRLANVRTDFETRQIFPPETLAMALATARKYTSVGQFLRLHRIRVVNLSWIGTLKDIEDGLAADPAYVDTSKRRARAAYLFAIERDAFRSVVRANPQILFVAGAGNSNSDSTFNDSYPSGLELPNLLVVGGVNRSGDPMRISSFGRSIRIAANGEDIRAQVPGGATIVDTGTSFAAPQVTNLAAKLLALHPTLTTQQLVRLIVSTSAPRVKGATPLINPRAAALAADALTVMRKP